MDKGKRKQLVTKAWWWQQRKTPHQGTSLFVWDMILEKVELENMAVLLFLSPPFVASNHGR